MKPAILIGLFIGIVAFGADARPHSHHSYYRNSSGHMVHSPSGSPTGASAKCHDGTYSYSEHRQGTCSHHGGVARSVIPQITNIQTLNVQTQARDANGIAHDIRGALAKPAVIAQANSGLR